MFGPFARTVSRPSLRREAPVTFWLLAANIVVFLLTLLSANPDAIFYQWGLTPAHLTQDFGLHALATVFTSMFLHGGWLHLLLNMALLWGLGRGLEPRIGSRSYALIYAIAGIGGALMQVAFGPSSMVPMVGASGAISGLLGAAAMIMPRQRMVVVTPFTLFIPVTLTMRTVGIAYVVLQVIGLIGADPFGGGVAYAAHLGGYLAGFYFAGWAVRTVSRYRRARQQRSTERVHRGPAPGAGYRTFTVTDARGRTFVFHEPVA